MSQPKSRGLLIVVSGPSGSGKSTLIRQMVASREFPLAYSVSATSRSPRPGELDGVHYFFRSRASFESQIAEGEFLEYALVHDNYYGTPRAPIEEALELGRWVIMDVDVQGYQQIKQHLPDALSFFVRAETMDRIEERLRGRGTESEAAIRQRLQTAQGELTRAVEYDFQLINESLVQAVNTFRTLLWGVAKLRGLPYAR